jgi:hypothetical protein
MAKIENRFFVVALDGENLFEDSLQSVVFSLCERNVLLQKINIGIELDLDEVRRLDSFLNGSEVDAFRISF